MGTVFLSRSWERDKRSIEETFSHLRRSNLPFWLMSHPEGTRATPAKIAESKAFAREKGLPVLENVLLPRIKGLKATLEGLRYGNLDSILDVTLCWDQHCGPLPFFFFGQGGARTCHALLREYPVEVLPKSEDELVQWIYDRWEEKDKLVGEFRRTGKFGKYEPVPVTIPAKYFTPLQFWRGVVLAVSIAAIYVYVW